MKEKVKLSWVENKGVKIEVLSSEIPHSFVVFKRDLEEREDWFASKKACEDIFCRMPTAKELSIIYDNKKKINKLMQEHGGEPMKDEWYWSSSENYNSYAWGQYFNGGDVDINTKNDTTNDVRPVLAL